MLSSALRRFAILASLSGVLLGSASTADAQRRARNVQERRTALEERGEPFRPANVSDTLRQKVNRSNDAEHEKSVLAVDRQQANEYKRRMENNTVEVLFQPNASEYGHILVRVGDKVYDNPNPFSGPRKQDFSRALGFVRSPMYGFVFETTQEKVDMLQRSFDALIERDVGFSIAGVGPENYSCAGFCTSVLSQDAPELGVRLTPGAKGAARSLLRRGDHDAVSLYGRAVNQVGNENFEFLKIE